MATREEPRVEVKVFVDKEKSRVIFAESGKEFVDVLFDFLTLPLGTVVRLLGKESQAGCLDELYKSVEGLPANFFRTEACKTMLLRPINAAARHCCQLKVRVDDTKHREVYVCGDTSGCAPADGACSSVPSAVCKCGKVMTRLAGERPENCASPSTAAVAGTDIGVFVKEDMKFIVTDDLHVAPASTSLMLSIFDKFEVQDPSTLEQRTLQLSSDKMISLLKRSLTSKNPLTGHYFDVAITPEDSGIYMLPENSPPEQGNDSEHTPSSVKIKVLQTMNNSSVLYAEVGGDFVDLLFGLLSIPLGSIVQKYGKCASKGCVDNLYSSIDGSAKGFLRPETGNGESYVKQGAQNFMVTDDLCVLPLSLASTLQVISEAKIQRKDLVEKELTLTKPQVMELLRAALVTRKALSAVLLPPKNMKKLYHHSFRLY